MTLSLGLQALFCNAWKALSLLLLLIHSRTQIARLFAARLARRFFTVVNNIMDAHAFNSATLLCATICIILKVYVCSLVQSLENPGMHMSQRVS